MDLDLGPAVEVLRRTPGALRALLAGLPADWVDAREGAGKWSAFDVVGHLIHGERTDWMPRLRIILESGEGRAFEPFDRFAQFEASRGKSLEELLATFEALRQANLADLEALHLGPADFAKCGTHPEFGRVTLGQLLATWVVHDLDHLAQVSRAMAVQYREAVGPWRAYLRVLQT